MTTDAEVAVVGGGIAGLAAAYELHRRAARFVLLEAGTRWGGVIRTEADAGFLLEGGPDALLAQKPEAARLCRELGLDGRIVPTHPAQRSVYVLRAGALHRLPEGMILGVPTRLAPLALSRLFTWRGKLRMAADLVLPRRASADESIAAFVRRRLGRQALERIGAPLLAGIHAGDAERLSVRATFPRLLELEARHGSVIRGLARARVPDGAPPFFSLRGGLSELTAALVAALPPERLRVEARVTALRRDGAGFALDVAGGRGLRAPAVLVALPAPHAAPLLRPLLPEASAVLARIPFVSTVVVCLGFAREQVRHPLDGYGLVVADERLRTTACGFFSTKFPGRAPDGHVLLRAFLGSARDPGVLDLTDERLLDTVLAEMGPVLGLTGRPALARVFRWPEGTPQMEVGHLERVAALDRNLAAVSGLAVTGAGLRATGIPDTIADARRSAAALVDAAAGNNVPSGTYREVNGRAGGDRDSQR